jgi:hypothetical protein
MTGVDVVIFHQEPRPGGAPLVRLLAEARHALLRYQLGLFHAAGARRVEILPGREDAEGTGTGARSFGQRLAEVVGAESIDRLVVLGSGAVPRLSPADARRLVAVASGPGRRALTNNRYSSDICAISDASALRELPPLPSDNALPRWLEERAGFEVGELPGRDRLALDLDAPLDIALLGLVPRLPSAVAALVREAGVQVPRMAELRELAQDPFRELLVFGRSGAATLRWLELRVRCRVRFLVEERGLRASSPLAIAGDPDRADRPPVRPPRATIGRLLADRGPDALAEIVAELADGAIVDSRLLMADRFGPDEDDWPPPSDRFASDLLRIEEVHDSWLRDLTRSAGEARIPILLGAHTLVGPGVPLLLGGVDRD